MTKPAAPAPAAVYQGLSDQIVKFEKDVRQLAQIAVGRGVIEQERITSDIENRKAAQRQLLEQIVEPVAPEVDGAKPVAFARESVAIADLVARAVAKENGGRTINVMNPSRAERIRVLNGLQARLEELARGAPPKKTVKDKAARAGSGKSKRTTAPRRGGGKRPPGARPPSRRPAAPNSPANA